MQFKIGELAKRIGITVRTLHHYDAIGLVKPSGRSEAGYRLYDRNDVARLYRIQALRGLGLSLAQTAELLSSPSGELCAVIGQQMRAIEQELAQAAALRERLAKLDAQLAADDDPDSEVWLSTLAMMSTRHKHFSAADIDALQQRTDPRSFLEQWRAFIPEVRAAMNDRLPPQSAEAKALSERWMLLVEQTMVVDPRFIVKLRAMHETEISVQAETDVDGPMIDYITSAAFENNGDLYTRYLTPEEIQRYRSHDGSRLMEGWLATFAEAQQLLEQNIPPEHPQAHALFHRWIALFRHTWGDDPATIARVNHAHQAEPRILRGSGFTPALQAYVAAGMAFLQQTNTPSNPDL
ncbi:MAG: MerR family transcriptional regulator [Burkholderiaceae bacterium]|nr:MAG: MerR family transcriptional regulator [Burkholderiaceae bacterium]